MFQVLIVVALLFAVSDAFISTHRSSRGSSTLMMAEKSKAIPFLNAPKNLDGLAGAKG
jgi:hypothetical protein